MGLGTEQDIDGGRAVHLSSMTHFPWLLAHYLDKGAQKRTSSREIVRIYITEYAVTWLCTRRDEPLFFLATFFFFFVL
jgi:hypothetical protein